MRREFAIATSILLALTAISASPADGYLMDSTVPQSGGCPALDRWNLSVSSPLDRRWSTSLPLAPQAVLTAATGGSGAQLTEIEQAISDSFGAWSGVSGTTFNATGYPGLIGPLTRVGAADSCTNDAESNIDGLNTICFNQSSMGFTSGVLAFTRVITANEAGASVGSGLPASFAGQILDADTLFRNDGQAMFATPAALATPQGQGAYDLESLLIHEIGHWFGFDHSAVWRAIMFPFAPPPGQFLGERPTAQTPDGPLSDDDRTGIRVLYPDPNDTVNVGGISGRVVPANPFALATIAAPSSGAFVTGIFGAHVVAVDSDTGAVIAGTLGGWACDTSTSSLQFDGSFDIERLPIGHSYLIYAEPLVGLALPADFSTALGDLCASATTTVCTTPSVDTNFNPRVQPADP
ncbi:MAG TPA: matrixin family metalloprotease [Candidatus Acidoferrales bacterium]|nr:matrixin family metalloprotease [Candidatus Acidoferrales bacterium]